MTRIRITAGGMHFLAETHPAAPRTVAAFTALLPYRQKLIHVRWSGEACWIPLGDFRLGWTSRMPPATRRRGISCSIRAA